MAARKSGQPMCHEESTTSINAHLTVSCLPTPASSNSENNEEEAKRSQRTSAKIGVVLQHIYQEHEQRARNESGIKSTLVLGASLISGCTHSEKNCPVFVMNAAGYVQKIPAVAFSE